MLFEITLIDLVKQNPLKSSFYHNLLQKETDRNVGPILMVKYSTNSSKCCTCYHSGYFEINTYLPYSIARGQKIPIFSAAGLPHNEVQSFCKTIGCFFCEISYRLSDKCDVATISGYQSLIFDAVVMSLW